MPISPRARTDRARIARARTAGTVPRHPSTARVRVVAGLVVVGLLTGPLATAAHASHTGATLPGTADTGATTATTVALGADHEDAGAEAALTAARALADGHPGTAVIGPDLVAELGYTPVLELTLAARGAGDCSSPVPLPAAFEPACRVHDLGYDLLRVAHRNGTPIPRGLRSDLDALLGGQMRDECEGHVPCTVMARIAETAVHLNTARQRHGAPVEERLPW